MNEQGLELRWDLTSQWLLWKEKEDTIQSLTSCDRKGMICAKIVFSLFAISVCKRKKTS